MLFGLLSSEYKRERRATVLIVGEKINGWVGRRGDPERKWKLFDNFVSLLSLVIINKEEVFATFGHSHFHPTPALLILPVVLKYVININLTSEHLPKAKTNHRRKICQFSWIIDIRIYNNGYCRSRETEGGGKLGMFILIFSKLPFLLLSQPEFNRVFKK